MPKPAPRSRCSTLIAITLLAVFGTPQAARADDEQNCLLCHQFRGLSRYDRASDQLHLFYVQPDYMHDKLGPHARLACVDCHALEEVGVVPHADVSAVTCTKVCHLQDRSGVTRRFSHQNVADMLTQSAHDPATLQQLDFPSGPLLAEDQSTCLYCHDEPVFRDPAGILVGINDLGDGELGRCDVCHAFQIPVDTLYYVKHITSRMQPARPPLEQAQVCAVCHANESINNSHEMHNTIASFARSFHGKAALLGDNSTASCTDCHVQTEANAHLMLAKDNPKSSVHPDNVGATCSSLQCHPKADVAFGNAGVHLDLPNVQGTIEYLLAAAFIVLTIMTFGPSLAICVLELFSLVIGRKHEGEERVEALTARVLAHPRGRELLSRFTVSERVQHWILVVFFTLLALTGFPMKFAGDAWAETTISLFGGLGMARFIHHWAGIALVAALAFHMLTIVLRVFQKMRIQRAETGQSSLVQSVLSLPMMVTPMDGLRMMQLLLYLLRLKKHAPRFGRFSVKEKFEYIGVFWGTILLGITGAVLWGEQYFSHFIDGRIMNLALIAHTYEAFLAIIHVGILHIINVMFKPSVFPLSLATITGQTPFHELAEEHPVMIEDAARELGIEEQEGR